MAVSPLHALTLAGQSIWADQISRSMLDSGELARRVSRQYITGVTSNPSIFAGAITKSADYDAEMARLIGEGLDPDETYAELITRDITDACDVLRAVHRESGGADGFVSVEVSPELAADTAATVAEAREWVKRVSRPNLLVKVPATPDGIPAIRRLTGEGISVNVTLIFSLQRYREVMDAYLSGLEDFSAVGGSLRDVASVASFFVSRVDTEVDRRLEEDGSPEASALRGKTAIANARAAYGDFLSVFSGVRWDGLAAQGARIQRPLWASTSTKNPAYPDTLYVDALVSPHTVNTLPLTTIEAYADHGSSRPSIFGPEEIARSRNLLSELEGVGIDYQDVVETLEAEGVEKFADSFRELQGHIEAKYTELA
ncbi:MAG: transaldolase [Acidimicrobiia bacterium]|nr:transaldolase [bacterium]MXX02100.1 transaldolase [Acidimicrobiia bacterium]